MDRENKIRKAFFFGDSNTFGYDPAGFMGGRYPREQRWTTILQNNLADTWQIESDGLPGRSVPVTRFEWDYLRGLVQRALPLDLFAVMLGKILDWFGQEIGFFLFSVLQYLIMIFTFGRIISYIKSLGVTRKVRGFLLFIFIISPFTLGYIGVTLKDIIYNTFCCQNTWFPLLVIAFFYVD